MKGIYSALIGCFDEAGRPNLKAYGDAVDYNVNVSGVDGLYVNGSTGENFNMTFEDRKKVLSAVSERNNGRIGLIAQVGCNVVEEIYELADEAARCGYDAISAVAPFYYAYTKDEVKNHYKRIAERSKLPLVIYNIPTRTNIVLTLDDFRELLSEPNIVGVKFTCQDMFLLEEIRAEFPDAAIFNGFDEFLLAGLCTGASGAIGTTYNISGRFAKAVYNAVQASDLPAARKAQRVVNEVVKRLLDAGIMQTVKAALELEGVACGSPRLPQSPINASHIEEAKKILEYIKNS